jgi:hypothetical protein
MCSKESVLFSGAPGPLGCANHELFRAWDFGFGMMHSACDAFAFAIRMCMLQHEQNPRSVANSSEALSVWNRQSSCRLSVYHDLCAS